MIRYTVRNPTDRNEFFWVEDNSTPQKYVVCNGFHTREEAAAKAVAMNAAEESKLIRNGLRFEHVSPTEAICHSGSKTYHLAGVPIPDEFDSAMRCGISPTDEFVAQIPLVWSCDCAAGQHGRDCKHVRSFIEMVRGE